MTIGADRLVRGVPRKTHDASLVNNIEVSVKTNSESGTILNMVDNDREVCK